MSIESNRAALRRLIRKLPSAPEIEKIIDRLRDETDLTVAVTATAWVEVSLEKLLITKLRTSDSTLVGQIFQNRGPLADFHSKILVAQAFGIITSVMAQELHSIKAVRNVFAHAKVEVSFDHELIKREIGTFKTLKAIESTVPVADIPSFKPTTKSGFILVAHLQMILMDAMLVMPGTADEAMRLFLSPDYKG